MTPHNQPPVICLKGLWNSNIPGITFDDSGISNFAQMHERMCRAYPRGETGLREWNRLLDKIKSKGRGRKFDCIVGVSGGTDSSYLLYLAKKQGLRPLAVHLDNGWCSDIAVRNIKKVTKQLDIPLETYVINYEEVKYVFRSYIKASLPWVDSPTDLAIKAVLYKIARREKISFILNGSDFRSEGKQPLEWTYSDAKQLKYLVKKFEARKLKSFPYYTLSSLFLYGYIFGIKMYRPYYYIDYQKITAQQFLSKNFDWEYYGGHHHENRFTKFIIGYWLPKKFGIDKRIITLSAQVLSGEITRERAISALAEDPYPTDQLTVELEYVLKKLDLTTTEFEQYFNAPSKYYYDYPSYMPWIKRYKKYAKIIIRKVLPFQPFLFFDDEISN